MEPRKLTTKTSEEINAGFDAVFARFATSKPEKPLTLVQWLKPYKKAIMKQRRRGIPWEEIARGMGDPRIGVTVSERVLRQVFGGKEKAAKARRAAAKSSASSAAAPVPNRYANRLILDPATGRRLPIDPVTGFAILPPPAPAPTTLVKPSRLPPRYQPVFDRVAPTIIRKACANEAAKRLLADAAVADLRCDAAETAAFTTAALTELDALDRDTAIGIYAVRPDDWDTWRPQWCEGRKLQS